MNFRLLIVSFSFISVFGACTHAGAEKANDGALAQHYVGSVLWYQQSAEMRASYHQCYRLAKSSFTLNVQNSKNKLPKAVVMDIDETVLDNSPFQAACVHKGVAFNHSDWIAWVNKAIAKALPGAVDFTQFIKTSGAEVFYISNRSVEDLNVTIKNLKQQGFAFADSAHVLLKDKEAIKTERRTEVSKSHEIALFVGDNLADYSDLFDKRGKDQCKPQVDSLIADWGTRMIVLPNPMYGYWEHAIFTNPSISDAEKQKIRESVIQ